MARRKLTDEQIEALMADYYAWEKYNPEAEDAVELAARHGISKPTLYNIKREWERAHGDPTRHNGNSPGPHDGDPGLESVVRYLTEELVKARLRIAELEAQLALRPPA